MKMKKELLIVLAFASLSACKNSENESTTKVLEKIEVQSVNSLCTLNGLYYSGLVEAEQTIPLSFESNGVVEKVYVEEGEQVKKGQPLATINASDARNMFELTKAKYEQAQDAYDRLKSVHESGSLPEIKWVEMESGLQQAKASYAIAKNNLDRCVMKAPCNAFVGERNCEPGMSSMMNASSPIKLVKIDKVYIKVSVPEKEINQMKIGERASILISAISEIPFTAKIAKIGVVANQIAKTYDVKLILDNKDHLIKPGMVCDVTINLAPSCERVEVPIQAVLTENNSKYVFVYDAATKTVSKTIVKIHSLSSNTIILKEGLKKTDVVVTKGQHRISNNQKVNL